MPETSEENRSGKNHEFEQIEVDSNLTITNGWVNQFEYYKTKTQIKNCVKCNVHQWEL